MALNNKKITVQILF